MHLHLNSRGSFATVWEKKEGDTWVFNHVSFGFEDGQYPKPFSQYYGGPPWPDQVKAWSKGVWRKTFMILADDGTLTPLHIPEQITNEKAN